MAIFKSNPIVTSISGNLGGASFAAGRGSPIIRQRIRRTKQTDANHMLIRARQAQLRAAWREFTNPQRTAWNTAASTLNHPDRLGTYRPTPGFNLFLRWNTRGWPAVFDPDSEIFSDPTIAYSEVPNLKITLNFTAGGPYLISFILGPKVGQRLIVYVGRTYTAASRRFWNDYRIINARFQPIPQPTNITTEFQALVGDLQQGEQCFIKAMWHVGGPSLSTQVTENTHAV